MKQSFAPIVNEDARVLVLGSMPGEASLRMQQYYAHPHNLFWKFIFACAGLEFSVDYQQRLAALKVLQVALWDVLQQCRREGSLDSSIEKDSERHNDIVGLLVRLPQVSKICFNGQKAYSSFKKHILKTSPELALRYQLVIMPSTSPANASQNYHVKFARWQAGLSGVELPENTLEKNMTRKEKWMSAPPEEIVCYCLGVSKGRIIEAIRSGCNSLNAIKGFTKACTGNECETKNPGRKCCSQDILQLIDLYADKADDSSVTDSQCCCKSKK